MPDLPPSSPSPPPSPPGPPPLPLPSLASTFKSSESIITPQGKDAANLTFVLAALLIGALLSYVGGKKLWQRSKHWNALTKEGGIEPVKSKITSWWHRHTRLSVDDDEGEATQPGDDPEDAEGSDDGRVAESTTELDERVDLDAILEAGWPCASANERVDDTGIFK
mmetsp:Transcript_49417/g.136972  ORF Transcript_49417/g.136972 Transcript_49417/m.136972 type:complete len:166 (-) Transcript_49417:75-572(-)